MKHDVAAAVHEYMFAAAEPDYAQDAARSIERQLQLSGGRESARRFRFPAIELQRPA